MCEGKVRVVRVVSLVRVVRVVWVVGVVRVVRVVVRARLVLGQRSRSGVEQGVGQ